MTFAALDLVKGGIRARGKTHIIEDEKFRFRPEEGGVGDTGAF